MFTSSWERWYSRIILGLKLPNQKNSYLGEALILVLIESIPVKRVPQYTATIDNDEKGYNTSWKLLGNKKNENGKEFTLLHSYAGTEKGVKKNNVKLQK